MLSCASEKCLIKNVTFLSDLRGLNIDSPSTLYKCGYSHVQKTKAVEHAVCFLKISSTKRACREHIHIWPSLIMDRTDSFICKFLIANWKAKSSPKYMLHNATDYVYHKFLTFAEILTFSCSPYESWRTLSDFLVPARMEFTQECKTLLTNVFVGNYVGATK